jgi:hypothetical protein
MPICNKLILKISGKAEISLQSGHFLINDLSTGCNKSTTAGVTSGGGTAYTSEAPELTPSF